MKQWFVAQVYAGYENVVQKDLMRRIEHDKDERFGQVLVPSAKLKSFFSLVDEVENERLFPGYILVEMEKSSETINIVASTPKVLKFLGGAHDPVPLSKKEIERILGQVKGEVEISPSMKIDMSVGGEVDIVDGPFTGFVGIVEKIDEENERLTVMVSIFGRLTPVELTFDQIKK